MYNEKEVSGYKKVINLLNGNWYSDSLEHFFQRGLFDYVKKNREYVLVTNRLISYLTLDVKCRFFEFIPRIKGKKVLYFPDNLKREGKRFSTLENLYDYVFFAHSNELIDNERYYHLPIAYDPYTHYPIEAEKTIDVSFIGTKHKGRDFIKDVPGIKIYGNEWGDSIVTVYGLSKAKVHAKTKIMINHHVFGDTSANMRDYEALAMKSFLLSDFIPSELEGGMVKYASFDDLLEKVAYYLEHESEREAIAKKGHDLVQPYTYEARMTEMMEVIEQHAT